VSALRRLLGYVSPYRGAFLLGFLCSISARSVQLAAPFVFRYAIDDLTASVTVRKLAQYGGLLLAIGLVGGVFRFLVRRILTGVSRDIEYDMRNDFFAHLERMPLSYFQRHRTGDLMSRATSDLGAVRMMVGPAVMYTSDTVLGFTAAIALMLSIDARLTLISAIPLPFVSLCVWYFGRAIHRRFEAIQGQLSDVSAIAQEALSGVRVIRAYRQEAAEIRRFMLANDEYRQRNRGLIALQGIFFPSMSFLLGIGAMLVLWFGSGDVIRGRITLGEFVAFNAYLTMLSWPMFAFGWVTNIIQRGMASWKRMLEVFEARPAGGAVLEAARASHAPIRGAIEFRNLTFAYDGGPPVLEGISATIEAGQVVALVGVTGSGKSTLANLLPRLYDPPRGTVFIDGVDVLDIPLDVLRGAIGFVPQEPFLFSDTLAANVAFGLDASAASIEAGGAGGAGRAGGAGLAGGAGVAIDAGRERDERIRTAAAIARLDKDVADFPLGYGTMVGERGITLSGGQKQRTAIARAVIVDPRILILDDALSAVDTYTEEEILSRLRAFMKGRTSIIVSHRISTVRDADQILVLDRGRVIERGTHAALVAYNGAYAALHRKQLLEDELAAS
jgi:ATP-binding cassette subfamily B protein